MKTPLSRPNEIRIIFDIMSRFSKRNVVTVSVLPSTKRLLLLWRKVLQQLIHGFFKAHVVLVGIPAAIQRLSGAATPNQTLLPGVIHIDHQSSDLDDGSSSPSQS